MDDKLDALVYASSYVGKRTEDVVDGCVLRLFREHS
jgi:hypothetical protein